MYKIESKSIGEAWVAFNESLLYFGKPYYDDGEAITELDNIEIEMEIGNIVINENKVEHQLDPILSKYADSRIADMYLEKMQTTEIIKELNSSYGKRIFAQEYIHSSQGFNQYEWLLNHILIKPETKSAAITLLLPNEQGVKNGQGTRIPCLCVIDYKLREGRLNTKVFFRSQNSWNSYANYLGIFWLSNKLANDLQSGFESQEKQGKKLENGSQVKLGSLVVFISNGHFYEKDRGKLEHLMFEFGQKSFKTVCDVLNHFVSRNCFKNPITWLNDLFDTFEYYANLVTACIMTANNFDRGNWYEMDKTKEPSIGRVSQRFREFYGQDKKIRVLLKEALQGGGNVLLANATKLYDDLLKNQLSYKDILEEKSIYDLKSNDIDRVILKLYDILPTLRNDINHDRQVIELSTYSLLKDICDNLILTAAKINLNDFRKSNFIRFSREGDQENVYCLNAVKSIGGTNVYRDMNYQTIIDIDVAKKVKVTEPSLVTSEVVSRVICNVEQLLAKSKYDLSLIAIPSGAIEFNSYNSINYSYEIVDAFYMAKYPVSNEEYLRFLLHNEKYFDERKKNSDFMKDFFDLNFRANGGLTHIDQSMLLNHAVYFIDWLDAVEYCNYLSIQNSLLPVYIKDNNGDYICDFSKNGYRLPTELEWYYAATSGKGTNALVPDISEIVNGDDIKYKGTYRKTKPNNELYENEFGLCGMLGNINEFTNSATRKVRLKKSEEKAGIRANTKRVIIKGGSFSTAFREIKNFGFTKDVSIYNLHHVGFRIVTNSADGLRI